MRGHQVLDAIERASTSRRWETVASAATMGNLERSCSIAGGGGPLSRRLILRPRTGWQPLDLQGDSGRYRDLFWVLAARDIKIRYKQTVLGIAWAVIQPLFTMFIFTIIARLGNIPTDGSPPPIFYYSGMLPWFLFANSVTSAGNSLVANQHLISKVYFPRLIVPISSVITALVDFCIGFVILLAMMAWYGVRPGPQLLALPLAVALAFLAALAFGFWLSALNAQFRDVRHVMPFVIQFWLFCTPVLYPSSRGSFSLEARAAGDQPDVGRGRRGPVVRARPPAPVVVVVDLGRRDRVRARRVALLFSTGREDLGRSAVDERSGHQSHRARQAVPDRPSRSPTSSSRRWRRRSRGGSSGWPGRGRPASPSCSGRCATSASRSAAGDVVGLIGHNGAGKSTLLKILSRITDPAQGDAEIEGTVGSLLEVGTGFHPELTGRENIYLNGAILGMKRAEITRRFDEIVAFAEIEAFLDTPVKKYSSGMYLRLAFAVAAHLQPDILIVDEVLAVGDVAFQRKCLGKMGDVAKQGRTVLFVSHNMGAVRSLCSRALVLGAGRLELDGAHRRGHHLLLEEERGARRRQRRARGVRR